MGSRLIVARLPLAVALFSAVLINCVVESQYYLEQPEHIYIVQGAPEQHQPQEFSSRKGEPASSSTSGESEEADEENSAESSEEALKGLPSRINLPPNFDSAVERRRLQVMGKRPRRPLHGDPGPIHQKGEDNRSPESRLLWPFSFEVTKGFGGAGGWGSGPSHHGSYHDGELGPPPIQFGDSKEYDPDEDPEVQKLRIELYKMHTRAKKWKKILKYNLAEVGAQVLTKGLEFLDFVY